jgi:hypothetical protein
VSFSHLWASSLEIGSIWRVTVAEWGAPPSSEMSTLGGEVLWGFGVGCGLVYSCRVEALSDVAVASMASLERGRATIEHLEEGYKRFSGETGGGDLRSLRTRCFLWNVSRSRRWR